MIQLERTDASNLDFQALVKKLDAYLAIKDGEDHAFYDQYNKIDMIKYVIVAYKDSQPVACGAIKAFGEDAMEVKRMYAEPTIRRQGLAQKVLQALEQWAAELGKSKCILETGKRQIEAVHFYQKNNYQRIPNYGQYQGVENSICFEKVLAF